MGVQLWSSQLISCRARVRITMSRKHNQVIVDFIELYRSEPCLWQVTSADYHDRAKKDAAYSRLAKKLEEMEPGTTKKSVLSKINSLRSAYRKEKKKLRLRKNLEHLWTAFTSRYFGTMTCLIF